MAIINNTNYTNTTATQPIVIGVDNGYGNMKTAHTVFPTGIIHHAGEPIFKRELLFYRYAYGAVEPITGDSFFLIMPYCSTNCMNTFLEELAKEYPHDRILLVCDGAAWHKSKTLKVPENITLLGIPPYTPEMNPIEQIWKQLRSMGFKNEVFKTLDHVVDRLCDTICNLTNDMVKSITCRQWILNTFLD